MGEEDVVYPGQLLDAEVRDAGAGIDQDVIVDQEERRTIIRAGAEKAAADAGLVLVPDEGLVNENSGLTEWPVPMLGRFDPAFLEVPREVIQLTMRTNQKYFAAAAPDEPVFSAVLDKFSGGQPDTRTLQILGL